MVVGGLLTPAAAWCEPPGGGGFGWVTVASFAIPALLCIIVLARIDSWTASLRLALQRRREARALPGSSPLHPLPVVDFDEVEQHVAAGSCGCGAVPRAVYRGPTVSRERKLWLVIEVCPRCHCRRRIYFDVTAAVGEPTSQPQPATPVTR